MIEEEQDYYALLGVERDAPLSVIRASYRRLMQREGSHPDRGGNAQTAALLNGAYAVLKDPEQRELYDARLSILSHIAAGVEIEPEPIVIDPRFNCLFCEQPHNNILDDTDDVGCDTCGSPLRVVDSRRPDPSDARAVQRLGRKLDVFIYTHWNQKKGVAASTSDISPHGLKLTSQCQLRPGQRIRISGELLDAVGRVTHYTLHNQGWRNMTMAGVSFLTLRFMRPVGGFVSRHV